VNTPRRTAAEFLGNKTLRYVFGFGMAVATVCAAQQPHVVNAKVESRSDASGLDREFRTLVQSQVQPAWIGYAVPVIPGDHTMCCCDGRYEMLRGGCALEGEHSMTMRSDDSKRANLEAPESMFVLFRAAERRVTKIRTYSEDCELDAGGLTLYWLTGVKPAESVALLATFVRPADEDESGGQRLTSGALTAIALTNDGAADRALDQFAASGQPEHLREQAAFWLGSARGRHGYETLARMIREDPDERFRKHATFALSVSRESDAIAALISTAKNDRAAEVRGQALFWLAQKAGQKAATAITDAIENDPETEVKKRAVFALSQLPRDEGVPLLIHVARTNRNHEVRKQAMFWLGQSNDPRALAFIEEVLLR